MNGFIPSRAPEMWSQRRLGFQWIPSNPRFFRNTLIFQAFLSVFCHSSFSRCPIHSYGTWMELPPATLPSEVTSSPVSMTSFGIISFLMNQSSIPTRNPDYFSGEEKGWERGKWFSRKTSDQADFEPPSFCHWSFAE